MDPRSALPLDLSARSSWKEAVKFLWSEAGKILDQINSVKGSVTGVKYRR